MGIFDWIFGKKHKKSETPEGQQVKSEKRPSTLTTPAPQSLNEFARQACKSKTTISLQMAEISRLTDCLKDSLQKEYPNFESGEVFSHAQGGLTLKCPNCGQLSEQVVSYLYLAGTGMMQGAVFGGSNVAALAQGRCPGCGGSSVVATFDPAKIRARSAALASSSVESAGGPAIKATISFPYLNSLTVSPDNEDVAWISRWETERFTTLVLSPHERSPRLKLERAARGKAAGYTAIQQHVLFVVGRRILVGMPLEESAARLVLLDGESGKELASEDVPDFKFYTLCVNNTGDMIAAGKDSESLLIVSISNDKLIHRLVRTGKTYGPTPYFAPNGRLYALHYRTFFSIEGHQAVHVTYTNQANSVAFDLAGKVYFGGGFSDRSGAASLQVVDLDSGESSEIPWGSEPIDVIEPLGDNKLLLGNMVYETTAVQYPNSHVSLFRVSERKKEWSIELADIPPYHAPILLSVPEDGWALLQSGTSLKRVSLDKGEVLEEFSKERNEFVQARWLGSHRMLCVSRNRSKDAAGMLDFYKIE